MLSFFLLLFTLCNLCFEWAPMNLFMNHSSIPIFLYWCVSWIFAGAVDDAKKAQQLQPNLPLAFMRTG